MIRADPIRVIEAIITGVSLLGAGTIIRRERAEQVEGLATAASILSSAGVGICVALRQRMLAAGVTVLALLTLRGVKPIDQWMGRWRAPDEHSGYPHLILVAGLQRTGAVAGSANCRRPPFSLSARERI